MDLDCKSNSRCSVNLFQFLGGSAGDEGADESERVWIEVSLGKI